MPPDPVRDARLLQRVDGPGGNKRRRCDEGYVQTLQPQLLGDDTAHIVMVVVIEMTGPEISAPSITSSGVNNAEPSSSAIAER